MRTYSAKLLSEILRDGNSHALSHRESASLRFGDESMVLPTVVLLGIVGFDYETDNVDKVSEHWASYRAFPMAANIQMVFYENTTDPKADVLVRILLNERDAYLPIASAAPSCYRWSDFSTFYSNKLKESMASTKNPAQKPLTKIQHTLAQFKKNTSI